MCVYICVYVLLVLLYLSFSVSLSLCLSVSFSLSLFSGAIQAPTGSYFGADSIQFYATYISCQGSESQIEDCPGFLIFQQYASYCPSTRAAGVKCLGENIRMNE